MTATAHKFDLPNGHVVTFTPQPKVNASAYILTVTEGDKIVSSTCSCNGVSMDCPSGQSVRCDCTKNPPVLSCG
jgi:hypothetical protein